MIALLRADFEREVGPGHGGAIPARSCPLACTPNPCQVGPFPTRKSAQLYESWVTQSGGVIKGRRDATKEGAEGEEEAAEGEEALLQQQEDEKVVVPLWLLKQSNDEQMVKLFALLRRSPATIHWYLEQVIFPSFMSHQQLKLSASGQELGGAMLFSRRLGFSGTPSDLLPIDLGKCGYERGSDGKMLTVLTDARVVGVQLMQAGWSVRSLLRHVATATPRFHALIDTGALITGLSNKQVAKYLLSNKQLSSWCEGVVFLDDSDEKMILVKATGRVLKLSQCGIAVEKRFAFYDQAHRFPPRRTPRIIAPAPLPSAFHLFDPHLRLPSPDPHHWHGHQAHALGRGRADAGEGYDVPRPRAGRLPHARHRRGADRLDACHSGGVGADAAPAQQGGVRARRPGRRGEPAAAAAAARGDGVARDQLDEDGARAV